MPASQAQRIRRGKRFAWLASELQLANRCFHSRSELWQESIAESTLPAEVLTTVKCGPEEGIARASLSPEAPVIPLPAPAGPRMAALPPKALPSPAATAAGGESTWSSFREGEKVRWPPWGIFFTKEVA